MRIEIRGRNVDVDDELREHVIKRFRRIGKQVSDLATLDVEIYEERNPSIADSQVAEATVWTKGPVLRARECSADMYASIDLLADKLERQVKRYRERRQHGRPHHAKGAGAPLPEPRGLDDGELPPVDGPDEPLIVKTKRFNMKPMHPQEAALQLELVGHDFFVFTSSDTDEVAVLYRRRDGNYGLIEPVRS
jgi:putative sigma-54 modulation protein